MTLSRRAMGFALTTALTLGATAPALASPSHANNNNSAKLRSAVTVEGVRSHQAALQDIADANDGNRYAGLPGHDESADYVVGQLEAAGYTPTVQEFDYDTFQELTPATFSQTSPSATTYEKGTDFEIMSYSGSGDVTAGVTKLADLGGNATGCEATDFTGFVPGTIALISRGTCSFRLKVTNAEAAGAAGTVIHNNIDGLLNGTLGSDAGLSGAPAIGTTKALGEALLATTDPVLHLTTDTEIETKTTRNVLAELPGRSGDENVVMVGAHLDSVRSGPGINDNGSGSAAILETAIQMAKVKPRNTVRFAWWSAEESGLVGAERYVDSLTESELDAIALYLNFDMIGSPNFVRFVYDGDNSTGQATAANLAGCETRCQDGSKVIESVFNGYFDQVAGLAAEPTPFNGRSDYGPFIAADIPAGGLFTGAEGIKTPAQAATYGGTAGAAYDPCYHEACDTYDNVSITGLDQMSDAVAHAVITFAQSTEVVNGEKGKGNFRSPAQSSSASGGAGGGGGLHGDHDHVTE